MRAAGREARRPARPDRSSHRAWVGAATLGSGPATRDRLGRPRGLERTGTLRPRDRTDECDRGRVHELAGRPGEQHGGDVRLRVEAGERLALASGEEGPSALGDRRGQARERSGPGVGVSRRTPSSTRSMSSAGSPVSSTETATSTSASIDVSGSIARAGSVGERGPSASGGRLGGGWIRRLGGPEPPWAAHRHQAGHQRRRSRPLRRGDLRQPVGDGARDRVVGGSSTSFPISAIAARWTSGDACRERIRGDERGPSGEVRRPRRRRDRRGPGRPSPSRPDPPTSTGPIRSKQVVRRQRPARSILPARRPPTRRSARRGSEAAPGRRRCARRARRRSARATRGSARTSRPGRSRSRGRARRGWRRAAAPAWPGRAAARSRNDVAPVVAGGTSRGWRGCPRRRLRPRRGARPRPRGGRGRRRAGRRRRVRVAREHRDRVRRAVRPRHDPFAHERPDAPPGAQPPPTSSRR